MLAELGSGSGGVWTAEDAGAVGLTPGQISACLRRGDWQSLHRGVYTDGGIIPSPTMRAWAAVVATGGTGGATASGRTAARAHGIDLIDDDDPLLDRYDAALDDVGVCHHVRSRPRLLVRQLDLMPSARVLVDGCPMTSPARTLLDLGVLLRPDALVCAVDSALHRGLVTRVTLERMVATASGHRAVAALRAAVAASDERADSPGETLARLLLRPHVPALEPQIPVYGASGQLLARLDLGVRAVRVGVEVDGRRGHAGDVMLARDRARERRIHPWLLERCTWYDVRVATGPFVERVVRRIRGRAGG